MTAPVVPTLERNRLGIAALVLVLAALAIPLVVFFVGVILSFTAAPVSDDTGYFVIGAFFFAFGCIALVSPLAIAGVVLAIVALTRAGRRKVQAIVALALGIAPSIGVFFIPAVIDTLF